MTAGALHGLRVVELAGFGPAPFCGMLLADMGADVVRVERAHAPERGFPQDARFEVMNRGRRLVDLDLKTSAGLSQLLDLVDQADVLIEGYRPGVMERLGAGPDVCLARNPRLVYGRVTGYGQTGPLAQAAGHDINYIAISGVLDAIGPAGAPPVLPLNLVADYGGGGMLLAVGILAARLHAQASGHGQVVDASMLDGSTLLMAGTYGLRAAGLWNHSRGSNVLDGGAPWYGVYETADGGYLALGAVEPRFYDQLLKGLGLDAGDLPPRHDRAAWPSLRKAFSQRIAQETREHWSNIFAGLEACVTPVLRGNEVADHPQFQARQSLVRHHGVLQPAPAPRFSLTPSRMPDPPAIASSDAQEILRNWSHLPEAADQGRGNA